MMQQHSIQQALKIAQQILVQSDSPLLDAQLLLSHVLKKPTSYLHTWPEKLLSDDEKKQFQALISRRAQGEPIAYILGEKQFWDLSFNVTSDVLIPRPETELIIEWVLKHFSQPADHTIKLADLGTGSGAIAISIAHAQPEWQIIATDFSERALMIAKQNAEKYRLRNIQFHQGSWCHALPEKTYDIIVSNPPYIDPADTHLSQGDLRFEPHSALASDDEGYQDLFVIAEQAKNYLKPNGILLLEHGYQQAAKLKEHLQQLGYQKIHALKDLQGHDRITIAHLSI